MAAASELSVQPLDVDAGSAGATAARLAGSATDKVPENVHREVGAYFCLEHGTDEPDELVCYERVHDVPDILPDQGPPDAETIEHRPSPHARSSMTMDEAPQYIVLLIHDAAGRLSAQSILQTVRSLPDASHISEWNARDTQAPDATFVTHEAPSQTEVEEATIPLGTAAAQIGSIVQEDAAQLSRTPDAIQHSAEAEADRAHNEPITDTPRTDRVHAGTGVWQDELPADSANDLEGELATTIGGEGPPRVDGSAGGCQQVDEMVKECPGVDTRDDEVRARVELQNGETASDLAPMVAHDGTQKGELPLRLHGPQQEDADTMHRPTPEGSKPHAKNGSPQAADRATESSLQQPPIGLLPIVAGGIITPAALVLAWLFSRIARADLEQHPRRKAILEAVQARPGIHQEALRTKLDCSSSVIRHHLQKLVDGRLIATRRIGGRICFFTEGSLDWSTTGAQAVLTGSKRARTFLRHVVRRPGSTAREAAVACGIAPSTCSYYLRKLQDAGLVDAEPQGTAVRLRATPAAMSLL